MGDDVTCGGCGEPMPSAATICPSCNWDLRTAAARPPRPSLARSLRAAAGRILLYGALIVLPVVGFARFRVVGPGPDLATTLRWMAVGDGGRAAELVTIHRMVEIAGAAARYAVREVEPPPLDGDWPAALAPFSTMLVRGWMPLLFYGATTDMAPASVRAFFEVRGDDGWGHDFRMTGRVLARDVARSQDPEVAADLAAGLQTSFFNLDPPSFDGSTDWMRLEITSAGRDGAYATADDLRLVSYLPVGFTLRLTRRPDELQRRLEEAYERGRHHYRVEGSRFDLIDARLLAEHRLEYLP